MPPSTTCSGVVLPTVSWAPCINQQPRKCHTDMPTGRSDGGTPSADSSLCQVDKTWLHPLVSKCVHCRIVMSKAVLPQYLHLWICPLFTCIWARPRSFLYPHAIPLHLSKPRSASTLSSGNCLFPQPGMGTSLSQSASMLIWRHRLTCSSTPSTLAGKSLRIMSGSRSRSALKTRWCFPYQQGGRFASCFLLLKFRSLFGAYVCAHAHMQPCLRSECVKIRGQFAGFHSLLPLFWLDRPQAVNLDNKHSHPLCHHSSPVSVWAPHDPYIVILQLNYQQMSHEELSCWRLVTASWGSWGDWKISPQGTENGQENVCTEIGRDLFGKTEFIQVFFTCNCLYPHYYPSSTSG